MRRRCGYVLQSWRGQQLKCCRPKGHKGSCELSPADRQESSRMWARFMHNALEKSRT